MFKQLFYLSFFRCKRLGIYSLISLFCAFSLVITNISPSYGVSWLDLILRGAQIIQLSSISDRQEVELGKQINQQLISSGKVNIYRNSRINSYVNDIGQKLAQNSERPSIPYTFQVVNDQGINAFATMGGFVYINSGLMEKADDEAELASVLAHEIGHITARHALKQMKESAIAQGVLSAAGLDTSEAVQIGVDLALSRPNSREDEFQADSLGLKTMKKTGYATIGMVNFMKKLLQQGNSLPTFLSTHPATSDRITALKQKIDPNTANRGIGLDKQLYRDRISYLR